ncbi:unnamed protein product, partial [Natator depressus]
MQTQEEGPLSESLILSLSVNHSGTETPEPTASSHPTTTAPTWRSRGWPGGPTITPSQKVYAEGSALNLLCRDHPSPALVYIWLFNELQEMLPRPPVMPNRTLVPENRTFTLPCNSSPRTDTVLCLRDGSYLVPSEGLGLSSESRTLTVPNAPRADTGTYWCEVGNLVSTNLSEPSNVTVPSPSYRWFLNGTDTNETESILTVNPTSLDQLGRYKCQAHNSVTGLTARMEIEVEEKLSKPTVTPSETQVLENRTFTLTCNTSVSADTVLWLRNGVFLAPSDRLGLSPDNRTLTVLNFTQADAGAYQCEVRNPISTNRSEPSTVTVAYGPESTRIDPPGPIGLTLGSSLTLTCVADSVPTPSYRWFFNGTKLLQTGSSLTINLTTLDQLGTYKCQADNPVTGLTDEVEIKVL